MKHCVRIEKKINNVGRFCSESGKICEEKVIAFTVYLVIKLSLTSF